MRVHVDLKSHMQSGKNRAETAKWHDPNVLIIALPRPSVTNGRAHSHKQSSTKHCTQQRAQAHTHHLSLRRLSLMRDA